MAGDLIGNREYSTYVCVAYQRWTYKVHRLAWMLSYLEWPTHEIDHINGIPWDNRIANLRDVPHRVNQMNQKRHRLAAAP